MVGVLQNLVTRSGKKYGRYVSHLALSETPRELHWDSHVYSNSLAADEEAWTTEYGMVLVLLRNHTIPKPRVFKTPTGD